MPRVIVAPVHALMQPLPSDEVIDRQHRVLRVGDECDREELAAFLIEGGFQRVTTIEEPGEFAVRGDIFDVFPPGAMPPCSTTTSLRPPSDTTCCAAEHKRRASC